MLRACGYVLESQTNDEVCHVVSLVGSALVTQILSLMGVVGDHYQYTQDLLALESQQLSSSSTWCTCGPSPLKLDLLRTYLHCHSDAQFAIYLAHGLSHGFHIGFFRASWSLRSATHNHP